ncbi:MAG TPA: hypothetical protein VD994_06145 [Prosthecobacter sp.]|nr:hypothetical protein [Prosthecobacter sp.]
MLFPRYSSPATRRLLFVLALAGATAWGCSVPVFRYALEHWQADPFQAIVFHRGALTPEQQSQIDSLRPADEPARPNLSVTAVDVASEMSPELAELWKQQPQATPLPQLVLRFPRSTGRDATIAAAPLAEASQLHLADSPARQEIIERLGDGQSAVWVMLDSGDAERDEATAKLLQERLDYLMNVLTLPELDQLDIANGLVSVGQEELRLEFSLLRLSRADAEERTFIPMLLASEPDLKNLNEPIVFPIFGRGRALYALAGKGIRAETIDRAATFLIGKCSCQVKEQNPGIDLLFTADWKTLAKASPLLERELPNLSHLVQAAQPVAVTTQPQTVAVPAGERHLPIIPLLLAAAAAAALAAWKFPKKHA